MSIKKQLANAERVADEAIYKLECLAKAAKSRATSRYDLDIFADNAEKVAARLRKELEGA